MKKIKLLAAIFLLSLCLQLFINIDNELDLKETKFKESEINQIKNDPIVTSFEKSEILPPNEIQREFWIPRLFQRYTDHQT